MTFLLTAFLSVSSGIIASSDGVITFKVTEALVERGEITLSPIVAENVPIGVGGKPVSRFGLALSLAAAPLYLLGKLVCLFTPEAFQSLALKGSVSLTNAIVSALVCLLLFLTGKRLGYPDRVPLQLTMSFAFTTFFIVNGTKSFLTQTLETLCLAGTLYFLIENSRGGGSLFLYAPIVALAGTAPATEWSVDDTA
jgi:hypothetical protein